MFIYHNIGLLFPIFVVLNTHCFWFDHFAFAFEFTWNGLDGWRGGRNGFHGLFIFSSNFMFLGHELAYIRIHWYWRGLIPRQWFLMPIIVVLDLNVRFLISIAAFLPFLIIILFIIAIIIFLIIIIFRIIKITFLLNDSGTFDTTLSMPSWASICFRFIHFWKLLVVSGFSGIGAICGFEWFISCCGVSGCLFVCSLW